MQCSSVMVKFVSKKWLWTLQFQFEYEEIEGNLWDYVCHEHWICSQTCHTTLLIVYSLYISSVFTLLTAVFSETVHLHFFHLHYLSCIFSNCIRAISWSKNLITRTLRKAYTNMSGSLPRTKCQIKLYITMLNLSSKGDVVSSNWRSTYVSDLSRKILEDHNSATKKRRDTYNWSTIAQEATKRAANHRKTVRRQKPKTSHYL